MAQSPIHEDGSDAVPKLDIAIVNEKSVAVEICRIHPTTFENEKLLALGPGQSETVTCEVTDCLVAKVDDQVVAEFGVCDELDQWRVQGDPTAEGHHCTFAVQNRRSEAVQIFCTEGDGAEPTLIQILNAGDDLVLDSFNNDYWEAKIGDRVVSAYQPSARRPLWTVDDLECEFVPELPTLGYGNLNEVSEPRDIDLVATGDVNAVMVFVDFPDVQGAAELLQDAKRKILGDASEWFRRESYGRLSLAVKTPVVQWRRMPRRATEYADIKRDGAAHCSYISTALKLFSREEINFADYQIAYVVAAKTPADDARYDGVLDNSPTLSAGIPVATNNGTVHHTITFGRDSYGRGYRVLVHETGHLFGLPDLYLFHPDNTGEFRGPAGAWDIMCDLDDGRHFLGWHKFKLGWLDESQLIYFKAGELAVKLTTLETAQGVKMIVLPSEHTSQLYIIEAAQSLGDDSRFRDKGLLIYTVDASVATGHEPVSVLPCGNAEERSEFGLRSNAYLAPGERQVIQLAHGARVEVINDKRIGTDFDVTVRSSGSGQLANKRTIPCPHCDPTGQSSTWLK